jgi:cellulose synthase/poly-beta-1,6-N-acetylglucosamine synthase-like glycosyltransferase
MTLEQAILICLVFVAIIFLLIDMIIIQKWVLQKEHHLQGVVRDFVFAKYFDGQQVKKNFKNRFFFDVFIDIETQVTIDVDVRKSIVSDLMNMSFTKRQFRRLKAHRSVIRRLAIFYIAQLKTDEAISALKRQFKHEKNESVRFFLAFHLIEHMDQSTFDDMIESLIGSSLHYQRWMRVLLANHYTSIKPFTNLIYLDQRIEIAYLILELANRHLENKLKEYALRIFREAVSVIDLRKKALDVIRMQYPQLLMDDTFLHHEEDWVIRKAIMACGEIHEETMIFRLLDLYQDAKFESEITAALSQIAYDSKDMLLILIEQYAKQSSLLIKQMIARILSQKIDYLILKLKGGGYDYIMNILDMIMELHIIEDFIDFVNHNKDQSLEKIYLPLIKKYASKDLYILDQFQIYGKDDILKRLGLLKKPQPVIPREKSPLEKDKIIWISLWVSLGVILLPLLAFLFNVGPIFRGEVNLGIVLIININRYLVVYFMTVNSIYLTLLILSIRGASDRIHLWNMKRETLLFEHGLLPSISIIAPAYNEEKSIIESVTSLLNLKYPTYEVIVVNDGSKDKTIDALIEHFELERKHPFFKRPINTKALRGVYINRHIPNLVVIDKQNGGKADALNLGINAARHDYVCGIDADSLLEEDALLKLMSVTLDDNKEHLALGGNIVPVNGCVVDQGKIEHQGLGKKGIVRFQTIEYLRAFTTGRIGWSKLNSLLIISGAFGLFQRKALIKTGGYLTISGDLKKDTVGEDMELVVRLTYQALLEKIKYRVSYVHHANCYTELPSDYKSLLKQRNRWQRGLLDILSYHRKMLFNPHFKQPGLIAFPYFFIFEMIGPFIELIGYLALIAGLVLGLLNNALVIMLFVATIGYGIVISLFSLWIAERKQIFYSNQETAMLILVGIIENFGYRQMTSLHRVISTFSALREKGSWGSQKRQGFQKR